MFDDASFMQMALNENQAREDAALLVRFEWMDIEDPEATKAVGYQQFKRKEFIRIRIPGTQEERVSKVKEEHRRRFPRAYAAFKAGEENAINGTPLKECAVLNANEISMLNHHGVFSVEQVAALSDENMSNMGHGVRPVRDRVKSWWEARKTQAPVAALQAQLKEKDEQVAELMARLSALEAGQPAPAPKPKRVRSKPKPQAEG
jgi:hypothetical protein